MTVALRFTRMLMVGSALVPLDSIPAIPPTLLDGETDGLAIDFTDSTWFDEATGDQEWNQVRTANVDSYSSPHTFYTNSGTSPKIVDTSATGLGWSPHNMFLNSATPATQNVTLVVGFNYTVMVTGAGGGNITGSAGASGVATTGSPATFTATTTTGTFTLTGSLDTIQLNRGPVSTTALATAGSAVYGLPISYGEGLLVEPAATNLLLRSEDITTTWANLNTTDSADTTTSPMGDSSADTMTENAAGGVDHSIEQSISKAASAITYTLSAYVKKKDRDQCRFQAYDVGGGNVAWNGCFQFSTGTFTAIGDDFGTFVYISRSATSIGNGWWRMTMTFTTDASTTLKVSLNMMVGGTTVYAGDGASGMYVWGLQVETGTVATSYVPTVSAVATRATDAPNVATSAYPHSDSEGTFIAWIVPRIANPGVTNRLLELNDGTANEQVFLMFSTIVPNSYAGASNDGGVSQIDSASASGTTSLAGNKVALFYKLNDSGTLTDGGSQAVDTSCTMATVTNLQLGYSSITASRELNGAIQRLIYVPRRMTEAEMQGHTT